MGYQQTALTQPGGDADCRGADKTLLRDRSLELTLLRHSGLVCPPCVSTIWTWWEGRESGLARRPQEDRIPGTLSWVDPVNEVGKELG